MDYPGEREQVNSDRVLQTIAAWTMLLSGVLAASTFTTWWGAIRDRSPLEWPDPVWRILYGCTATTTIAVAIVLGSVRWSRL